MMSLGERLNIAIRGHLIITFPRGGESWYNMSEYLITLLREATTEDINWKNPKNGKTLLHYACSRMHSQDVIALLSRPDILVNERDSDGRTPFYLAYFHGRNEICHHLIDDKRVELEIPSNNGKSAIDLDIIDINTYWIRSGRPFNHLPSGYGEGDAKSIRHALRQFTWYDQTASAYFALIVFLMDGLLMVNTDRPETKRFFSMVMRLPMEVQMIMAHRMAESPKINIPATTRESAFRNLFYRTTVPLSGLSMGLIYASSECLVDRVPSILKTHEPMVAFKFECLAIIFSVPWKDTDIRLQYNVPLGVISMTELAPNAFDIFRGRACWIHYVRGDEFYRDSDVSGFRVTQFRTDGPVAVINVESRPDCFTALKSVVRMYEFGSPSYESVYNSSRMTNEILSDEDSESESED